MIKPKTVVETTLTYELTAQDILAYAQEKNLVPKDWNTFSIDIIGKGISQGATLILKNTKTS